MDKKTSLKVLGIVATVFIVALTITYAILISSSRRMLARCTDYEQGEKFYFIDCNGVVSFEYSERGEKQPKYELYDHKYDISLALINSEKDYKVIGDYIFVKDKRIGQQYESISKKYELPIFVEPGVKTVYRYDHLEDVPKYLKINYHTGITTPYLNYEQMPEEERSIFQSLE